MTEPYAPNLGIFHVRKWYAQRDETIASEFGLPPDGEPLVRVVVAAALRNPCAGRHVQDLSRWAEAARELGLEFGRRVVQAMAGVPVRGYGKACLVGTHGEYEHGNMLLTTHFADPVREAVGGAKAWIPSSGKRGGPGDTLDIPLAHKDALYVRAHYDTVTVGFADAPGPDEVVIAFAAASRGRLHARLGGLQAADVRGEDGLR
ncbi:MAG: amino acid synthesis family protein [Burkholderiaceae bacterium]